MVIRTRLLMKPEALAALAALLLAGCGEGSPLRGIAGGTSSKDKKPIPPAVNAAAAPTTAGSPAAPAANPAVQGPAVAAKGEPQSLPDDPGKPLREQHEEYRAGTERDPFASLLGDRYVRTDLVDLGVVRLVAIVTSGEEPFCVVEDPEGVSYVLRVGDAVRNGRVVGIKPDVLVCSQTVLGYTTTVQLKLDERKDVKHG